MQPSIYWLNDLVGCNFACLNVATFAECATFAVEFQAHSESWTLTWRLYITYPFKDCICVLPTDFIKSVIFRSLPFVFQGKNAQTRNNRGCNPIELYYRRPSSTCAQMEKKTLAALTLKGKVDTHNYENEKCSDKGSNEFQESDEPSLLKMFFHLLIFDQGSSATSTATTSFFLRNKWLMFVRQHPSEVSSVQLS